MKTTLLTILLALTTMFMVGCESDTSEILIVDEIPEPPQNVFTVTGDGEIYIYFTEPYMDDISYYDIYRSFSSNFENVTPTYVGSVAAIPNKNLALEIVNTFTDFNTVNGQTYYYRIKAIDEADQESDFSAGEIFDTPRPQGTVTLFDTLTFPSLSALLFGEPSVPVSHTNTAADFFIDEFNGSLYINAADIDTDIQDMGFTYDFENIGYAPDTSVGWSTLGFFELIDGHTYVFWTRDDHYAKVRVLSLTPTSVNFEWAFQTDVGNPELVKSNLEIEKPIHDENYLKKNIIKKNQ